MKFNFRWKLIASYLALVLVVTGVLYAYLNRALERNILRNTEEILQHETGLARLMAANEITDITGDAPSLAEKIGRETRARVTIVTGRGAVAGDSEVGREELGRLENHADRPEIAQALQNGSGSSVRYSTTLKTYMLYVALPFSTGTGEKGAVRLSMPLSQIDLARIDLQEIIGAAILPALLCCLLLGYVFSNITNRPLRVIAGAATRIGKGEMGVRIPVTGKDEVDKLATVMNDMAVRLEMQLTRISTERNRLDTILTSMGEGVMVTDRTGTVTLANPSFRSLFSLDEYVEGESLIELTRQPILHNTLKKVLERGEEIVEEIILHFDEEKTILTHWVPLHENGKMTGVVAVFHDISDLKKLEKVRRDFVANVSHELRTPVAVIKGYAETLLYGAQDMPPDKVSHFSQIIHNHAERLTTLIGDLLTLSQLESGKLEMHLQSAPLHGAVNRACSLLESKAKDKEITVRQEMEHGAVPVLADLGRLEQVLINLLDNAIKYTPQHGSVTISTEDAGAMLKIKVKDTGIGIPAKDLPRIFERFYRVDAARSRELGGTGLGLSIVKHIVQAHGGSVSVESSPRKGSTFSVTLRKA